MNSFTTGLGFGFTPSFGMGAAGGGMAGPAMAFGLALGSTAMSMGGGMGSPMMPMGLIALALGASMFASGMAAGGLGGMMQNNMGCMPQMPPYGGMFPGGGGNPMM